MFEHGSVLWLTSQVWTSQVRNAAVYYRMLEPRATPVIEWQALLLGQEGAFLYITMIPATYSYTFLT